MKITTEEAEAVMKRCQRGTTRYSMASDLHAECYVVIDDLLRERDRLRTAIERALADSESGTGWGPDVTVCSYLRQAIEA